MIEVFCVRGDGDKEMNEIESDFLSTISDAVRRGKYEIDKQWFFIRSQAIDAPFKKSIDSTAIMDGDIITVSDSSLGIFGSRKINSIVISGTNSDIKMKINSSTFEEYI